MGQVDLFEFVQAGLLQNVDVEIVTATFDLFDYQGKQPEATALRLDLKLINDDSDEVQSQYFTVGGSKDGHHLFVPSEDGQSLEDTGGRSSLALNSNYQALIKSLIACGLDPKKMGGRIGNLDGTVGHVIRSKASNINAGGDDREILVFSEVRSFGYDGKKKGGSKKKDAPSTKAPKAVPVEAEESGDGEDGLDTSSIASELAMDIVTDEKMAISKLRIAVFKRATDYDNDVRKVIAAHALDVNWLTEQGFTVEGKEVSL